MEVQYSRQKNTLNPPKILSMHNSAFNIFFNPVRWGQILMAESLVLKNNVNVIELFQDDRAIETVCWVWDLCQYLLCCCLTAQGQRDCPGSGPFLSESVRHWTHLTPLDIDRGAWFNITQKLRDRAAQRCLKGVFGVFVMYRGWSNRQSRADCRQVCWCCRWEERQEGAPRPSQSHCQTEHWGQRRGEDVGRMLFEPICVCLAY